MTKIKRSKEIEKFVIGYFFRERERALIPRKVLSEAFARTIAVDVVVVDLLSVISE